jgi:class 3 adenylate cyclase/tetratricopeptide (TPR) repeat protein
MKCPRCQQDNPPQAKFCLECATPLALRCANCGTQLPSGAKFCFECAKPVSTAGSAPRFVSPETYTPKHLAERIINSKAALEGERKQVTILFADLKGSMELLADRDPEEARKILDPVLEHMMEAVHHYEGTVNQVMGDGIMALFGAPVAHEDHAVRACYAALRMQEAVKRYAEEARRAHGVTVRIRVGLNSGEVVVRAIGSDLHMDYTAVGQTTHLAARMEQLADPGAIVIASATLAAAEGYVEARSLGAVPVKGLADAIDVYEVTGAGPARTRLEAGVRRGLTRFVGRDAELEQLRKTQRLARDGHGQVTAIVAEAGVGKSRLVHELTHSPWMQGWRMLKATSVSYGKGTSYLPVIDLLKSYFTIHDRDEPGEIAEKVTSTVLALDRAMESILPALLALLDLPVNDVAWQRLEPAGRRQRTFDAVKRLLLREAREQPLLVIFEDLHWIDDETQALLDVLVESVGSAPVLLLVNYRPEYQHAWGGKTYYSQLRLDALPTESTGELLGALLGEDPGLTPLKHLLIKRGNPFFLEETVRTLVEMKALAGQRGQYRLMQPLEVIQMPATVHAILAARMDRLSPEDKRLLQVASVVGKDVPFAVLQQVAEVPDDALRRGLDRLQSAEFIYETGFVPDPEYTFKHALTHEVAYEGLLLERRRALHGRVVEVLEAFAPERIAEQVDHLAHHALRGEAWDKAIIYCQQAGAKAYNRAAFREAVASFEQALAALAHLPKRSDAGVLAIELRLAVDGPLTALAEYGRRLALLAEAETLARALDDRVRLGRVLAQMAQVKRIVGNLDGAIDAGQQAFGLAVTLGDSALRIHASHNLGQIYETRGDFGRAVELLRHNVEAVDTDAGPSSTDLRIRSLAWLARTLSALGDFDEGQRHGEEALRLATLEGRGVTPIIVHGCLGELYLAKGDLEQAIQTFDRGLTLCRSSGNRDWLRSILADLGYVYALRGQLAEGRVMLEKAITEGVTMGARHAAYRIAWLSEIYRQERQVEEALERARLALNLARQHKTRGEEALALHQLGAVYTDITPLDTVQAEAHYRQALVLADELGMRPLTAHCHSGLANLYRRTGKSSEWNEHFRIATTMYREMGMTYWLEKVEAEMRELG